MIERAISWALKQRLIIIIFVVALVAFGIHAYVRLPIDAFPDVTNKQVQIITEAPGRSPEEVEKYITYPIEAQMMGIPKLTETRSLSKFGLSVITVVFEDDVDIYFARQLVLERLIEAKGKLPEGIEPVMGPISTGLGEIYQYTLEKPDGSVLSTEELMEFRTIQDWVVKPILKTVPGVTDVNSFGGMVKQYHVLVDPIKLRKYHLSLHEVFETVSKNNSNAGGNVFELSSEQYIVRGIGLIRSLQDLGNIIVKSEHGTPVFLRDIAETGIGHEWRPGAVVKDGKSESVAGIVLMIRGGSGKEVVAGVKKRVEEINKSKVLPKGLQIKPFYDRTDLVEKCIQTVTRALGEGAILIIIILYLFLRNIRGALVVTMTLPLAVLSTFIVMREVGLSANLMSLGGLAISLGMIVDAAIIQVENVQRHLSEKLPTKHKMQAVFGAVLEVRKPSLFGELIIAFTFIPIMTLQGMEGKMFSPLAFTVVIALLSSLLLSIFVIPVFCYFFLKPGEEKESLIVRGVKRIYLPVLRWAVVRSKTIVLLAVLLLGIAAALFPFLGTEFIPTMDEGILTPQVIRLPSVSLSESIEIEKKAQQALLKFPEVKAVVSKIGAAELATDPMGVNLSDPFVILKPKSEWKTARTREELVEKIREELQKIPGIGLNMSQPIALRVDELISGVKSQLAIKLFGEDMEVLREKAEEIARIVQKVEGVADLRVEQTTGQPYLIVDTDRDRIARYGINVEDINEIIETAVGGKVATVVLEGDKKFQVVVRFPEEKRNSVEGVGNILVRASKGVDIPLAQLAKISVSEGPVQIGRENARRRIIVECNVEGRDIGGFVHEAQEKIQEGIKLPPGYYLTWGGAFQNQQRAMKRLMLVVPLTIGLIFFLLYMTFSSIRYASLILLTLPFALVGGIAGLLISGQYLSVPASVGFIALLGVAVLNGVVLVTYINKLREEGAGLEESISTGCEKRLRPILMTASVAILGLIPLLFATGPGSEVQRPLAAVVVGGLITSTIMTLIVLPTLYKRFAEKKLEL
jgi:cobalt-zinc-cadmium resistance protein CzcA